MGWHCSICFMFCFNVIFCCFTSLNKKKLSFYPSVLRQVFFFTHFSLEPVLFLLTSLSNQCFLCARATFNRIKAMNKKHWKLNVVSRKFQLKADFGIRAQAVLLKCIPWNILVEPKCKLWCNNDRVAWNESTNCRKKKSALQRKRRRENLKSSLPSPKLI